VDYNFADVEQYPQFKIYTAPSKNTKDQAETDKILINDIGLPVGEKYLYEKYNIPIPEEGEKLVNPPKPAPEPAQPFGQFADAGFDFAERLMFAESSMDEVDRLIARQVDPAAEALDRNIDLVKEYLARATRLETAKKGLPKLLAEMNASRLADALSTGMQTAWNIGVQSVGADQDFAEVLWGPGTPFKSAMDYFKSRAFYISNVTNADNLAAVEAEIEKAMEGNLTLEEFKKEVGSIFTRSGYDLLSPYQIKAVFQTNLHINYQGGRYYQMKSPAVVKYRPYWRLVAVKDGSTRPAHWAMHGKIFPQDHPFWDTWYPPNGYNCRCTVVSLSQREMDRNGWKVETQDPTGLLYEPVDPFTGIRSPARLLMPDTGWAKNPAKEVWEADFKKYSPDLAAALKKQVENL
jgi:SPP1 gp7 family putative phage head morphogenesis protein